MKSLILAGLLCVVTAAAFSQIAKATPRSGGKKTPRVTPSQPITIGEEDTREPELARMREQKQNLARRGAELVEMAKTVGVALTVNVIKVRHALGAQVRPEA